MSPATIGAVSSLGLGGGFSVWYEVAWEFAYRNMPGRLGDPVVPFAHAFAEWAETRWTSGHVCAAFDVWVREVSA